MQVDSGLYILGYIIITIIYVFKKVEKNWLKQGSSVSGV